MRYALLKDGAVVNTVEAAEGWQPPAGFTLEAYSADIHEAPAPEPEVPQSKPIETWQFFSVFDEGERTRYFLAEAAGSVAIKSLQQMLLLHAGGLLDPSHPIVQYGLYTLRASGIIASDERLTEIGNTLQAL